MEGEGPGPRPHSGAGRFDEWRNISTWAFRGLGRGVRGGQGEKKIACRWRDRDEQGGWANRTAAGQSDWQPFRSVPGSAGWP